jgi:hypothetical protein
MLATADDLSWFWWSPWTAPLRSACIWLKRQPPTVERPATLPSAPRHVRPLCVQRWVGQAVAERLVWWRRHPDALPYRYHDESLPRWSTSTIDSRQLRCLRVISEAAILLDWRVEVERLLRIAEAPPALLGEADWAQACLTVLDHLALLYGELKRRRGPRQARAMLREELRCFVIWEDYGSAA